MNPLQFTKITLVCWDYSFTQLKDDNDDDINGTSQQQTWCKVCNSSDEVIVNGRCPLLHWLPAIRWRPWRWYQELLVRLRRLQVLWFRRFIRITWLLHITTHGHWQYDTLTVTDYVVVIIIKNKACMGLAVDSYLLSTSKSRDTNN